MSDDRLPLSGVRVLEFTHAVLGPACGLILADLGADVIRIERTPDGDPTRRLRGFGLGYFTYFNRNKRSLVVDLKADAGQEIVRRLLDSADILIENFGPGTMERLGLGYGDLAHDYPRLIYAALKGFLPGPYENRVALDEVVQMMSGLAYMTGRSGDPLRAGASIIDITTGMMGAIGVLVALQERAASGRGQLVRSALFETAAFIMAHHMTYAAISQQPVPPMPERVSAWAIYHQFETQDRQRVFVGVTSDAQWQRFCSAFGYADWVDDLRLATNNGRIAERAWLLPQLRARLGQLSAETVILLCEKASVSFAPIARPEDLFDDPQLVQGNSLLETRLPDGRVVALPRLPLWLDGRQMALRSQAAAAGEHSAAILAEVGYNSADIAQLQADDIVKLGSSAA